MRSAIKGLISILFFWTPRPRHPSLRSPGLHLRWRIGWIKGCICRPCWQIKAMLGFGPKITVGKRFSLQGSIKTRGTGRLIVGDDVIFDDLVTPFFSNASGVIAIGNASYINGTRFGCAQEIRIGQKCILADARIMDTDFHPIHGNRFDPNNSVGIAAVLIGNEVWIAGGVAILKGVQIGNRSMIGFGSVVTKNIPENSLAAGVPAVVVGEIR